MRARKWIILIGYLYFLLSFGYLSYSEFVRNGHFNYLFGVATLLFAYQIFIFLKKAKREGWNSRDVIADRRIINHILFSLAISYIVIMIFLVIGLIGLYEGFIDVQPIGLVVVAIFTSVMVFMLSQIVQRFVR